MAFLDEDFSVDSLPEGRSYDLIPEGWYQASIVKADLIPTKDNSGKYIALRLDIIAPTHQGRCIFSNVNIRNKSAVAEQIGRQQLGEIMRAIGLQKCNDTDLLIGGNLEAKVVIKQAEGQYEARNEIKGYRAISSSMPKSNADEFSAPPVSKTPAQKSSAPPWIKK